jgi:hypothetical protein
MEQRIKPLTPIRKVGVNANKNILWEYLCFCGAKKVIAATRVRNGYVRSCGCLKKETKPNLKHGMKKTPTYTSWTSAKNRTLNPKSKDYARYGGAGITFSKRWLSFENFLADMGIKPVGTSLDRIDGSKGYEPGNCRWATLVEQARNRKDFKIVKTQFGDIPLVDYAKQLGITRGAAHLRYKRKTLEGVIYESR